MSSGRRWGDDGPPLEAYSRVTDAERFTPLHTAMLEMILGLEAAFDVVREESYGLDEELEKPFKLARPSIKLGPNDPDAAAITVAFSDFPGLNVRFGRWSTELFPVCGCDACDESADGEIKRVTRMIDSVTDGGFREAVQRSSVPFVGRGWLETEFRTSISAPFSAIASKSPAIGSIARRMPGGRRRSTEMNWTPLSRRQSPPSFSEFPTPNSMHASRSRLDGAQARRMTGGRRRLELNWRPWPRR